MKNKKGQVILLGFMLFVVVIIFALGIAFSIRQGADIAMGNSTNGMNCTNVLNPDSTTAACYISDITPFIFIGCLIAIGSIYLIGRWVFGG